MRNIDIFVIGKYEYRTGIGNWIYYLNYKNAVIKRSGYVKGAGSPNRTMLISLYKALRQVTEPCNITIHSKAALGFKKPKQSTNKDMIIQIQTLINKVGHIVTFDTSDDFGRVNIWEQVYGTNSDGTKTQLQTQKPDIINKKTANEVFEHNQSEIDKQVEASKEDWRAMYSDLMGPSQGCWVPGSGGY